MKLPKILCRYDEMVDIDKIKLDKRNPNKGHDIDGIIHSMKKNNIRKPIMCSKLSKTVNTGEGRFHAMKKLGFKQVPVEWQEFENDTLEYVYMVADNELSRKGKTDLSMMNTELGNLDCDFVIPELDFHIDGFGVDISDKIEEPNEKELDENINTEHECPSCGYKWS